MTIWLLSAEFDDEQCSKRTLHYVRCTFNFGGVSSKCILRIIRSMYNTEYVLYGVLQLVVERLVCARINRELGAKTLLRHPIAIQYQLLMTVNLVFILIITSLVSLIYDPYGAYCWWHQEILQNDVYSVSVALANL